MTTNTNIVAQAINVAEAGILGGLSRHKAASAGQYELIKWHRERGRKVMGKVAFAILEGREDLKAFVGNAAMVLAKAGDQANTLLAAYAAGLEMAKIRGWNAPEVHAVSMRVPVTGGEPVWKGFTTVEEIMAEFRRRTAADWSYDAANVTKAKLHAELEGLVKDYPACFGGGYTAFPLPEKKGTWKPFMGATFNVALRVGPNGAERCARLADYCEWLESKIKADEAQPGAMASNHYIEESYEQLREKQLLLGQWQDMLEDPRAHEALRLMGLFNKAQEWAGSDFRLTVEVAEKTTQEQAVALVAALTAALESIAELAVVTEADAELEAFLKS